MRNRVDSLLGRYLFVGGSWLNESTVTWQNSKWNPSPENISDVGQDYLGVIRIGGRDTTQEFTQSRISLRDDLSRSFNWHGSHSAKAGAVSSFLNYDVTKLQFGNPVSACAPTSRSPFPSEASYGVGNPDLSTDNRQLGFFVQDDWTIGRA